MQVISSARPNPDRGRQAGAFAVRHVRRHRDDDAALGQVAADFRETAAFMRGSGEALVRSIGITPPLQALDLGCSEIVFLPQCFVRVHLFGLMRSPLSRYGVAPVLSHSGSLWWNTLCPSEAPLGESFGTGLPRITPHTRKLSVNRTKRRRSQWRCRLAVPNGPNLRVADHPFPIVSPALCRRAFVPLVTNKRLPT
jgi:hypothetical protein